MRSLRHDRYNSANGCRRTTTPARNPIRASRRSRSATHVISLLLTFVLAQVTAAWEPSPDDAVYRDALQRLTGVADAAGARTWIEQHAPGGSTYIALQAAIADLSHPDFERRMRASRQLAAAPYVPEDLLEPRRGEAEEGSAEPPGTQPASGGEFESTWRRAEIARAAGPRQRYAAFCAAQSLRASSPDLAAAALIRFLPTVRDRQLTHALWDVVRHVARPTDQAEYERLRAAGPIQQRAGAAVALAQLATRTPDFVGEVRNEQSEEIRLAAAIALARRGESGGLALLEELLAAPQPMTRREADRALQILLGQNVGFDAEADATARQEAILRWRQQREAAPTARGPERELPWELTGRGTIGGQSRDGRWQSNTLIATGAHGLLLEFTSDGGNVWRYPQSAWSLERLPNGRLLVAALDEQRVLELDRLGRITWEYGPVAATRAKPLANGNYLIVDFHGARVLEVDRQRQIVRSITTPDLCFDAEQRANGHTVFGCANLVREVAPDGFVVREWKISGRVNGIQCLPDGHLLVANYGSNEVAEYDREGRVVRRWTEEQPCDARRLADGHTLVTTSSRVVEFTEDGKVARVWSAARYGTARRDTVE